MPRFSDDTNASLTICDHHYERLDDSDKDRLIYEGESNDDYCIVCNDMIEKDIQRQEDSW